MSATHNTKNFAAHGGNEWVIGGKLTVLEGAEVAGLVDVSLLVPATAAALGGVKAAAKGVGDTVEVKVGDDDKLYAPAYPADYVLPAAAADALGGVKAAAKGVGDTVEVKVGDDDKLYAPTYPADYVLPAAAADALGGVKLAANQEDSVASTIAALKDDFNALLTNLKAAGIVAPDAEG